MKRWFKGIWTDPVWSKVIAVAITAACALIWSNRPWLVDSWSLFSIWMSTPVTIQRGGLLLTFTLGFAAYFVGYRAYVLSCLVGNRIALYLQISDERQVEPSQTPLNESANSSTSSVATSAPATFRSDSDFSGASTVVANSGSYYGKARNFTETEVRILKHFAERDNECTEIDDLARLLSIKVLRVQHVVDKLFKEDGLIDHHPHVGFALSPEGVKYVIERNWV